MDLPDDIIHLLGRYMPHDAVKNWYSITKDQHELSVREKVWEKLAMSNFDINKKKYDRLSVGLSPKEAYVKIAVMNGVILRGVTKFADKNLIFEKIFKYDGTDIRIIMEILTMSHCFIMLEHPVIWISCINY